MTYLMEHHIQARIYHINHPAHAPCSLLYVRQKINLRPLFSLIIYTVAPQVQNYLDPRLLSRF